LAALLATPRMMDHLEIYYDHEHQGAPVLVGSADEIDALVERVRLEYQDKWPVLMMVSVRGAAPPDDSIVIDHMLVGVSGSQGVLFYGGTKMGSFWSLADKSHEPGVLTYYYCRNDTDFPVSAEVSLELVKRAVWELLGSGGDRPECVGWQAYEPGKLVG